MVKIIFFFSLYYTLENRHWTWRYKSINKNMSEWDLWTITIPRSYQWCAYAIWEIKSRFLVFYILRGAFTTSYYNFLCVLDLFRFFLLKLLELKQLTSMFSGRLSLLHLLPILIDIGGFHSVNFFLNCADKLLNYRL